MFLMQGDTTDNRFLGDTQNFCPVALKDHNVLWPCTNEIAAKYREKTYYFSSPDARDSFLLNPEQFIAKTEPLKVQDGMKRENNTQVLNKNSLTCSLSFFHPSLRLCGSSCSAAEAQARQFMGSGLHSSLGFSIYSSGSSSKCSSWPRPRHGYLMLMS